MGSMSVIGALMLPMLLVSALLSIFLIVCNCKIYMKMGEPWWSAIIPIYNIYILIKHVWDTKVFFIFIGAFLFSIIGTTLAVVSNIAASDILKLVAAVLSGIGSIALLVVGIITQYKLCAKFNKGIGFFLLVVLVPIVGYPILAFGKTQYGKLDFVDAGEYVDCENDYNGTMDAMNDVFNSLDESHHEYESQQISYDDPEDNIGYVEDEPEYDLSGLDKFSSNGFEATMPMPVVEEDNFEFDQSPRYVENDYATFDIKDEPFENDEGLVVNNEIEMDDVSELEINLDMEDVENPNPRNTTFRINGKLKGKDPSGIKIID